MPMYRTIKIGVFIAFTFFINVTVGHCERSAPFSVPDCSYVQPVVDALLASTGLSYEAFASSTVVNGGILCQSNTITVITFENLNVPAVTNAKGNIVAAALLGVVVDENLRNLISKTVFVAIQNPWGL